MGHLSSPTRTRWKAQNEAGLQSQWPQFINGHVARGWPYASGGQGWMCDVSDLPDVQSLFNKDLCQLAWKWLQIDYYTEVHVVHRH